MIDQSGERGRAAAVVLAAGAATRFGAPKQRLLLPLVLGRLAEAGLEDVVVVEGAYPLDVPGARVVRARSWDRGPGASLRAGLDALGPEIEAAVVVLADGPLLAPDAVSRVLGAWRPGAVDVLAASYAGDRGHPLVLGRAAWGNVPDEGLRSLSAHLVPCDDLGSPGDVDTPADLDALGLREE
jgi:CTP:molybdopterin cytidylyltransferase MocA